MANRVHVFIIAAFIAVLDQASKFIISEKFYYGQQMGLINDIVSLTRVHNTGAAFSLFQNNASLLAGFSILVTIIIIVYFIKIVHNMQYIILLGWGFILGGTIGNL